MKGIIIFLCFFMSFNLRGISDTRFGVAGHQAISTTESVLASM